MNGTGSAVAISPVAGNGEATVAGKDASTVQFLTSDLTEVTGDLIREHFAVDH